MKTITIKDKQFDLFLTQEEIENAIDKIAKQIAIDLSGKNPLFLCVLNGAFMFASELMKRMQEPSQISFVKVASYDGMEPKGSIKNLIGLSEDIKERTIVILEDIVDTGFTMKKMLEDLQKQSPASVYIASLLFKPEALQTDIKVDYAALSIPPDFIVGYGLDYDGYGRNLPNIYKLHSESNESDSK